MGLQYHSLIVLEVLQAEYERVAVKLTGKAVALVRQVQQAQQVQQQAHDLQAQLDSLRF